MAVDHPDPSAFPPPLNNVLKLLWVMEQLRHPEHGCPWDRQQTFASIVPFTIEEAYEVADAIERGTVQEVQAELGDLLFQVVFYAQFGKEAQLFEFDDIAAVMVDKLIRRHPHVFASAELTSTAAVKDNWEAIKHQERQAKQEREGDGDNSILGSIAAGMPPLIKAQKLQKQCAKVGFDWHNPQAVAAKVTEELGELITEIQRQQVQQQAVEEEVGDLLFAVVNLSRHVNVDAETALRKANYKFERRFREVERNLTTPDKPLSEFTLDEMERAWRTVKGRERDQ